MTVQSNLKLFFPVFIVFLLIAGCAKVSSPSGGIKDTDPPEIIKSIPLNGSKNFTAKRIVVTFNEYIALDQITEKFMVSPPMDKKPEISVKGKNLVIEYEDELKDSTTYTFYFQDAIKDLNEGNAINNYSFVFSTGPVIDSLSVTGNIYKAFDLNPPENTLVMLYSDLADSAFIKMIPDYISRADKKGYFRIDNVKEGRYRLYALVDADNSKNFNLADEEMAFIDSVLLIDSQRNFLPVIQDSVTVQQPGSKVSDTVFIKGEYKLILFQPPKKNYYLTSSSRNQAYKLNYTLSLPPDTLGFEFLIPGTSENGYIIERNPENDSIQIWLRDSSLYAQPVISTIIRYPFTDSTGIVIQKEDTTLLRFLTPRVTRGKQKPVPYRIISSVSTGSLKPRQHITFNSPTPFRQPDTSKIILFKISDTDTIKIPYKIKQDTTNSCRMTMTADLLQGQNYLLIADSAAFGNIYGEVSDSTGNKFSLKEDATFGRLILNVKNYEGNRIIQLLSNDEKVVREIYMDYDGKAEFAYLDKGLYRLRIIYDTNKDGKWTTGDFLTGQQPEPVSFMPLEIEIKENWENELFWDVGEKNVKKFRNTDIRSPGRK